MLNYPAGPLPRINALRAFEAAARLGSFVRAAEELGIHQPSVSRYVAELERDVGVELFERSRRAVVLTPPGAIFHRAVAIGLERIASGALSAASLAEDERVVIACGPSTSRQFVMPRFPALRRTMGETVCLRILTLDPDVLDRLGDNEADLVLTYRKSDGAPGNWVAVFEEAVTPVCSPGFAATHARVLAGPVAAWGALPFLRLARPPRGWVTWHDWFEAAGYPTPRPRYTGIEDYVYLLEAAVAGQGLALGWRHFIDSYLDAGTLVTVADGFVETGRSCFARLTGRGRQRPVARRCLDAFAHLASPAAGA
ncbi:MAG: LysR family transcriptional regulator [Rhodospirillaceae bacterium]|nr:LysR family transcriptional regulator [Rhodospirillaceae bacterium]MDE0254154.1 LysR family transcriptional regulator [Rhodospirillaceae bacterium]MDE0616035.1 LysR family transcriptional regulator [Rhodospirillaceae bacterium]